MTIKSRTYFKYLGLFIIFGLSTWLAIKPSTPSSYTIAHILIGEGIFWLLFIAILIIAKFGEKDPIRFDTNGMGLWQSSRLIVIAIVSMYASALFFHIFYRLVFHGPRESSELMTTILKQPYWISLLWVVRAGVVEETFYRAYAISRIKQLTGNNYLAFTVPLIFFAGAHIAYGTIHQLVGTFFIGLVLAWLYLRTRNLVAMIVAHSLFDSIGFFFAAILHSNIHH